ncbi:MAG: phosphatidate cytidylyltransferase [bacterium]|nr:phosphatidate cytidylyltransferase [bacterium]MDE0602505.1 phosphatidate cytidylyltransferase [bacterium]
MKPPDTTWVPDWEPDEEPTPIRPVRQTESEEPDPVLTGESVFDSRTTQHQALAEEVMEAEAREHRQQAVSAAIPGVESGMLGFEDVTGRTGMATEEVEAAEQAQSSDLVTRIVSAMVMVGVLIIVLYLGGAWLTGLILVTMGLGLVEFYMAVRSVGYRPMALLGLAGTLGAGVAAHVSGLGSMGGVLVGALALVLLFYAAASRRMALENATLTLLGMIWISLLSYAVVIGGAEDGVALLVWVLLLNSVFDTAAFVVGRGLGNRPLSPSLSSKKTLEGLLGGVFATFAIAAIFSTLPTFSVLTLYQALFLAAVVSVLAPLGDGMESAVKRSIGLKDMSSLLPGHGGILDRIDGLLLVFPGAYYLFSVFDYL